MTQMNYVITSTLPEEFGGRTKSLLSRTKKMNVEIGTPFSIITTNYHPNYNMVYNHYYEMEYVSNDIKLLNIYDFLANRTYEIKQDNHPIEEEGLQVYEVEKDKVYRYFDNGEYVLYKNYTHPNNQLKFIDEMDRKTRIRKIRKEYNYNGLCHKKTIYKQGTTHRLEEIFYDEKGQAYLNKTFNGSSEDKLVRIYYFNKNEIIEFSTEKNLFKYCFDLMIEEDSTVICDARLLDRPLIEMNVNVKKVFILHSSHLTGKEKGEIKKSYKYIIEQYEKIDYLVTLTEQQKKDLVKIIKDDKKIRVIPHSALLNPVIDSIRENKLVFIGTLSKVKQVDHLIEAYNIAREELVDFQLDIYGEGEERSNLEQLVTNYKLQDKITFKGTTKNPEEVFSTAKASFITSKYEGFGLVIMESLNNGCPVVAYDLKYGPRDLITPNKNGIIIEQNNINELAKAMIRVTNHKFKKVSLSKQFSDEQFIKNWQDIFMDKESIGFLGNLLKF